MNSRPDVTDAPKYLRWAPAPIPPYPPTQPPRPIGNPIKLQMHFAVRKAAYPRAFPARPLISRRRILMDTIIISNYPSPLGECRRAPPVSGKRRAPIGCLRISAATSSGFGG